MLAESALPWASRVRDAIAPACLKTGIAGSLRRRKDEVHDIELIALPRRDFDLYGDETETFSALDAVLADLVREGMLAWDTTVKRNGPRYKRFVLPKQQNLPVEIFLATHENWGVIKAIRTGSAAFTKAFVTPCIWGGLCPNHLAVMEGHLWRYSSQKLAMAAREAEKPATGKRMACPTEEAFFETLQLPFLPPPLRGDDWQEAMNA